jgi:hypothetical protein
LKVGSAATSRIQTGSPVSHVRRTKPPWVAVWRMLRMDSRKAATRASATPQDPAHSRTSSCDSSIQQAPQVQLSSSQTARTMRGAASRRSKDRDKAPVTPCSITIRCAVRERRNCDGVIGPAGS